MGKLRAHELSRAAREATRGVRKENTMITSARNPVGGEGLGAAAAISRS
jgi:hypothetical protein